ncbi:MAG: hypothetical protein E3J81_08415 [Dehalococcoidia bacterium]|nr:MAG: hypothetical protein E3J81_08415 [Dehalococcoidia bacterium]
MGIEYRRPVTLLGIVPFTGQVIFYDDFEGLFRWVKDQGSGAYVMELDPTIAFNGKQSLRMETRTVGASDNDDITAYHRSHLLPSKTLTATIHFNLPSVTPLGHLLFRFRSFDGAVQHEADLYYNHTAGKWSYIDVNNAVQSLTGSDGTLQNLTWHRLVAKINFDTGFYTSLQINELEIDMSALAYYQSANAANKQLLVHMNARANASAPVKINFAEVSLTEI